MIKTIKTIASKIYLYLTTFALWACVIGSTITGWESLGRKPSSLLMMLGFEMIVSLGIILIGKYRYNSKKMYSLVYAVVVFYIFIVMAINVNYRFKYEVVLKESKGRVNSRVLSRIDTKQLVFTDIVGEKNKNGSYIEGREGLPFWNIFLAIVTAVALPLASLALGILRAGYLEIFEEEENGEERRRRKEEERREKEEERRKKREENAKREKEGVEIGEEARYIGEKERMREEKAGGLKKEKKVEKRDKKKNIKALPKKKKEEPESSNSNKKPRVIDEIFNLDNETTKTDLSKISKNGVPLVKQYTIEGNKVYEKLQEDSYSVKGTNSIE